MPHEPKPPPADNRQTADAGRPPKQQRTVSQGGVQGAVGSADEPDAKLPHERDESPGNAADTPRAEGRKAYEDAKNGMPDTDKSPVMDQTYHRMRK